MSGAWNVTWETATMSRDDLLLRDAVCRELVEIAGGDPFHSVLNASEEHRPVHGVPCGLYPAGPAVMSLVAQLVRAARAHRVLDLGCGFGYSTLWLAAAGGPSARITAIDQFTEHIEQAEAFAEQFGLAGRIEFVVGDVASVLATLNGPFDLIHDDAWFASAPPYLEAMLGQLTAGGVVTMANWFLLEDAIVGEARRDWSELAGPAWAHNVRAYSHELADRTDLTMTWVVTPPLGIAIRA